MAETVRWFAIEWSRWGWEKHWRYMLAQIVTLLFALWWIPYSHLPWTGVSIATVAILAALMSVHPDMKPRHKAVYFALMAALLVTEFRAIRKDRIEAQDAQNQINAQQDDRLQKMLAEERENTKELIDQENKSFDSVLRQDQGQFTQTMSALIATQKQDQKDFADVVEKEEGLFQSQQNLSEEFSGRLVPGNTPTPENACGEAVLKYSASRGAGAVAIFGTNAATIDPSHTDLLDINGDRVLSLDKIEGTQSLALYVEMRDQEGRILFRIDKNGLVNPRNAFLVLHPDPSTLLLQDSYGRDFMRATMLNANAISVSGDVVYCGKVVPIQYPDMTGACLAGAGKSAIGLGIPTATCPKQP